MKAFLSLILFFTASCLTSAQELPPLDALNCNQVIYVSASTEETSEATVTCYSRANSNSPWVKDFGPTPAQIGRNGIAKPNEKKEGDGKTPSGSWPIGYAFGFSQEPPVKSRCAYRQATPQDFWIDSVSSPLYNMWFSGEVPEISHEALHNLPIRYEVVLTTLYNSQPIIPEKGSAIFFHLWLSPSTPTSGCVSVSREDMLKILEWIDPKKSPKLEVQISKDFNSEDYCFSSLFSNTFSAVLQSARNSQYFFLKI